MMYDDNQYFIQNVTIQQHSLANQYEKLLASFEELLYQGPEACLWLPSQWPYN